MCVVLEAASGADEKGGKCWPVLPLLYGPEIGNSDPLCVSGRAPLRIFDVRREIGRDLAGDLSSNT